MTKSEAIKILQGIDRLIGDDFYSDTIDEAVEMAIEALSEKTSTIQEKHQLSEETPTDRPTKSTNIPTEPTTGALKSEPSEDLIKRSDAIEAIEIVDWYHQNNNKDMVHGANDDEHQAWYKADDVYKALEAIPSANRPKDGDLISRTEAIEALGEEPPVWCDEEYEIAERDQWRADVEAIKSVPSADRPKGKWIYWREDGIKRCKCSRCLTSYGCLDTPYCPNCGKKMVEGRIEE